MTMCDQRGVDQARHFWGPGMCLGRIAEALPMQTIMQVPNAQVPLLKPSYVKACWHHFIPEVPLTSNQPSGPDNQWSGV